MPRRVGLYGGAFDPPHQAHTALARAAIDQHALAELIVLPTGQAWHKSRPLSDAVHRVAMTQLAFASVPHTRVDAREIERGGASYTVQTLEQLRAEQGSGAQWFVLMGADQWLHFESWHRYQDILADATILVADRSQAKRSAVGPAYPKTGPASLSHERVHMPLMDVSATDIRHRAARGLSLDHLVNPSVARYIAQHALYQFT